MSDINHHPSGGLRLFPFIALLITVNTSWSLHVNHKIFIEFPFIWLNILADFFRSTLENWFLIKTSQVKKQVNKIDMTTNSCPPLVCTSDVRSNYLRVAKLFPPPEAAHTHPPTGRVVMAIFPTFPERSTRLMEPLRCDANTDHPPCSWLHVMRSRPGVEAAFPLWNGHNTLLSSSSNVFQIILRKQNPLESLANSPEWLAARV